MAFSFDLAVILQRVRRRIKKISKVIRRRQRDICKSHEPLQEIPFDLVIDILTRLPPKSLMRFKSVSKVWSSLICSKYFTNLFQKVSSPRPRLFMLLGVEDKNVLLSSSSSPDFTMSSFVVDQDLTLPAMEGYSFSHVFHGLMCFTNGTKAQIYNTTTRQLVVLPDIEESNIIAEYRKLSKIIYHIGHDPVHDQYKVVCIVSACKYERTPKFLIEHWVFILGEGVSSRWRKISSLCPPHIPLPQILTNNGRMYYLTWDVSVDYPFLVRFDISSEETRLFQKPEGVSWPGYYLNVIEYAGKVAVFCHSHLEEKGVVELWVMEDEEKNVWSRKKMVLHPSQMNILDYYGKVQGTTRNGDVILAPHNNFRLPQATTSFYIVLYNIQKNHLRRVEIKDGSNIFLNKTCDAIGFDDTENLMYL